MAKKNNTKAFTSIETIDMEAVNKTITIREVERGYENNSDDEDGGVTSMNGRLNIRPRYQRLYIADLVPMWRENLINSIICGFPINRIYIGVVDSKRYDDNYNGRLEVLDGQQRIITICEFLRHKFSIKLNGETKTYTALTNEQKQRLLDYKLDVTYCCGTEEARIAWFKRINQKNSILTPQELRNATYVGTWLECAKKHFCATSIRIQKEVTDVAEKYCFRKYAGSREIERSEYLELAIDWIAYDKYPNLRGQNDEDDRIMLYMAEHKDDDNADELINHYHNVIDWVNDIFFHDGFPTKQSKWQNIKNQDWGKLYTTYKNMDIDDDKKKYITKRVADIISYGAAIYSESKGIYEWVLRGEKEEEIDKYLHLHHFKEDIRQARYNAQGGICPLDNKHYEIDEMEAHHIIPRLIGGSNQFENCVMLSKDNHHKWHAHCYDYTNAELTEMRDKICRNKKNN